MRKKAIRDAALTALATVLVLLAGYGSWWFHRASRLGWIELKSDGTPLVAQVLSGSGDAPLGEPFDVVTGATLALPAGDYRLRARGVGRVSRTYRFAVNQGETEAHFLSLDEGRLLGGERDPGLEPGEKPREEPIPFPPVVAALELTPGKADFVEWTGETLIRRDAVSGKPIWDASRPAKPYESNRDPVAWIRRFSYFGDQARPGTLVESAPDVNGDGIGDLIWAIEGIPAIVAVSGKDGALLWTFAAKPDGPGGPDPAGAVEPRAGDPVPQLGRVLTDPVASDVDGDGTADMIAAFAMFDSPERLLKRESEGAGRGVVKRVTSSTRITRVVVAVSGRTGRWLWNYLTTARETLGFFGRAAAGRLSIVSGRDGTVIALHEESQWIRLDPATGQPRGQPIELGFCPMRALQRADLDGDGDPDVLAIDPSPAAPALAAFSSRTGAPIWKTLVAPADYPRDQTGLSQCPLLADFDGDGRPEIVVPDSGTLLVGSGYRGLRMIDGATGQTRWARPLSPGGGQGIGSYKFLDGPDLDGDGTRDVVVVSQFIARPATGLSSASQRFGTTQFYADAISGKDGHSFWWWSVDTSPHEFTRIWPLELWGRGPDGWPLLAVPMGGKHRDGSESGNRNLRLHRPVVHLIEMSTGREVHTVNGLTYTQSKDLDGDGLADLWGEVEGQLRAYRGESPEAWRALGRFGLANQAIGTFSRLRHAAVDFDGDGVADTLSEGLEAPEPSTGQTTGSRTAIARSGRDGRVIWKTRLRSDRGWSEIDGGESYLLASYPMPDGDLDGDGTADVIVHESLPERPYQTGTGPPVLPVEALSGRTGARLWPRVALARGFEAPGRSHIHWIEPRSIERDGAPDLLIRHGEPPPRPYASLLPPDAARRPHLTRISGRDGRVVWDMALVDSPTGNWVDQSTAGFDDVDGDGVLDAILVIPPSLSAPSALSKLAAISLKGGATIWSRPIPSVPVQGPKNVEIAVSDLDGDARPEVVMKMDSYIGPDFVAVVMVRDARDGKDHWTWHGRGAYTRTQPRSFMTLADLDGNGQRKVCVVFVQSGAGRQLAVLGGDGREIVRRGLPADADTVPLAADLDGDGRDELLIEYGGCLRALGPDLKQRWLRPVDSPKVERILPGASGEPATVVIGSSVGLDGLTGNPRWAGQSPLKQPAFDPVLLAAGDSARLPLLIAQGHGTTVCRWALPMGPSGRFEPPPGARVRPRTVRDDPRWSRDLPWTTGVAGLVGLLGFLAVGGFALVNLVVPLWILRLARGRRGLTVRYLSALPVAFALPLAAFVTLEPLVPRLPQPLPALGILTDHREYVGGISVPAYARLFVTATVAGIPVVTFAALAGWMLVRRRFWWLAALALITLAAAVLIGAIWLRLDMREMSPLEHYVWSGWQQPALAAVYAVGAVAAAVWAVRGVFQFLTQPSLRGRARAPLSSERV